MQSYKNYKSEYERSLETVKEIGEVESVMPPIVFVKGIPGAHSGEVVYFETGEMGFILSLGEDLCEILTFSQVPLIIGTKVSRSGSFLHIPVGEEYLGHSIDPRGIPNYDTDFIAHPKKTQNIEEIPPGIDKRTKIVIPFLTGVSVVDLMVPLGKGQRELVLGDRKTGKTEFFMQVMLTQAKLGTICIYSGIGKKKADIKRIEEFVEKTGLKDKFIVISTNSTDPLGLIFITPYAAMTMAEFFAQNGKDVLLILDDLTTHAKFYREISLVAKRFPGRNAYPGDVFYSHSRLLERAGSFNTDTGSRSITCLIGTETVENDISGYIQTNLMSITDGHIFFDKDLFEQGRRPSVNYFYSVTRVGRQTQNKVRWGINRELSSFMTLYEKTQRYIHFGAEVNEGIRSTLDMGTKLLSFFDQPMGKIIHQNIQIAVFCLIWVGFVKGHSDANVKFILERALKLYETDTAFKSKIDTLIEQSTDFNGLLGKFSMEGPAIITILETKQEEQENAK